MENFINCFKYIQNKIQPNTTISSDNNDYKLIERKRILYYFSKFSIDINELSLILKTIRTIKENILINLMESIKFCSKGKFKVKAEILNFLNNNINDNERLLIIFTNCFLHFYSNFNYNIDFSFEIYFDQNLINLFTKYNIYIINLAQFKIFCYAFYHEMLKEIRNNNYNDLKKLYDYYNYNIFEEQEFLFKDLKNSTEKEKTNNFITLFKYYTDSFNINKLKKIMTKKIVTPLISGTERVVEMVLSVTLKLNKKNISIDKNTTQQSIDEFISNKNSNNQEIKEMEVDLQNHNKSFGSLVSLNTCSTNPRNLFSKRILCELIKSETNEEENLKVIQISNKLSNFIDVILNKSQNKFHFIQDFLCYIVEINSELIRILPEYQDLKEDINIRYIIPAKNVYNFAIEIYFALYDLYNIDLDNFIEIFKKKCPFKFENNLIKIVLFIYKQLNEEFLKNYGGDMNINLENLIETFFVSWEKAIIQKGKEMTSFCKV